MPELTNLNGLDISHDMGYQRRMWKVERVAWVVIVICLIAAGVGVFGGSGPLTAGSRSSDGGGLEVRFDRFVRFGAPSSLGIQIRGGSDNRNIAISRAWIDDYDVTAIVPQPESVTALADSYVYTFDVGDSGVARLSLEPRQVGRHHAVVTGPGDQRVEFSQLVYP